MYVWSDVTLDNRSIDGIVVRTDQTALEADISPDQLNHNARFL